MLHICGMLKMITILYKIDINTLQESNSVTKSKNEAINLAINLARNFTYLLIYSGNRGHRRNIVLL